MRESVHSVWIALALALILICLPDGASLRIKSASREMVSPFNGLFAGVSDRMRSSVAALFAPAGRATERERLLAEVVSLQMRVHELEMLERENAELRALVNFEPRPGYDLEICRVTARDASGWWETLRLNKGAAQGLTPDMAVVGFGGLVGRTISVSDHTCEVRLITDGNCKVSARLARTGSFGVLQGKGAPAMPDDKLVMVYVPRSAELLVRDEVVTSGLGGVFPEGLAVGWVASARPHESGLYQVVHVVPSADLDRLSHVFVLKEKRRP